MESLKFPVAAIVAATIKFAWTSSSREFKQQCPLICRIFCRFVLAILTGAIVLCASVSAAEAPLTLPEAQRRAVERSRQTSAQDLAIAASREMALASGRLPDPVLTLGIDNLPIDGPDQFSLTNDFMTMRRIGLMQEFTRSEKRQLRAERFEREAEKFLAEKTATIATIQRGTALAWLDRYYAEATAAAIAEQIVQVRREILAVEGAYRGGRGNQADVFAVHGTLVGLEVQASELDRQIRTARINLARWIGDRADAPLSGKPAIDSIRLDPAALDTQLAQHPEITILAKQEEIASTEARMARAEKKADWSLEVAYQNRGPSYSDMVSVGVSIPLQWDQKNRQDREFAAKLALAEKARAEREETLRAHTGEVRAMIAEWENGRERLARYERELIPISKERSRATLSAYQGGKAGLSDLLLARRNETDVRLQTLQVEMDTARLWAQLNFLFPESTGAMHEHASTSGSVPKGAQRR